MVRLGFERRQFFDDHGLNHNCQPPTPGQQKRGGAKVKFFICFILCFSGCTSVQQTTTTGPLYSYRADTQIQVGGAQFDGMGVWKLTAPVDIEFSTPHGVTPDRIQITSCARQDIFENQKSPFVYHYVPVHAELGGMCPLYFEAYSKKDLISWGFIGFRFDEELQAHIDCNGQGWTYAGLTVCQTKSGLEQLMSFPVKVEAVAETGCHMTTTDKQNFKFVPDKGFCRATFVSPDKKWHRLILLGYDSVLVRVN